MKALAIAATLGLALVAGVVVAAADARAPHRSRFTGSEACGTCHAAELASWRETAHARPSVRLGDGAKRRQCQACHTTGDAPAGRPAMPNIGCEACHGAGTAYAEDDLMRNPTLARELGLVDLSTPEARAAACAPCHATSTRIAPFDAEAAWQRIKHGGKTPPPSAPPR